MEIFTTYYSSPVGWLQLQSSNEAVTCIRFMDDIGKEEPYTSKVLQNCIQQLDEYFSGKRRIFELPVIQQGTEFQKKIWNLLTDIPYGKTTSYQQLARQYGDVKAIRAVASANGKNNLPVIVP